MDDQLVGYLLGCLDDEEQVDVEAHLKSDPRRQRKLELLRRGVKPLEADRADPEPPSGLVERTLCKLGLVDGRPLPRAPHLAASPQPRAFWSRVDFMVAACLLVIFFGLAFTSIWQLRQQHYIVGCKNNLHNFWFALNQHHDVHNEFPNVNAVKPPRNVAGIVVPMLIDKGLLAKDANVRCPANGKPTTSRVAFKDILKMSKDEFDRNSPYFLPCYAYSLGYRDDKYYGPKNHRDIPNALMAIMADQPPKHATVGKNSPNHHGDGQNVLFCDGSVRYSTTRKIGLPSDDIYLNQDNKVGAGIGPMDAVLGSSSSKP